MDVSSRKTAVNELRAIPEFFYTTTQLPIITPLNYHQFCQAVNTTLGSFTFWSWCSGSSRLLLTMTGLPFERMVLFPVDLRYGWDISHKAHQGAASAL